MLLRVYGQKIILFLLRSALVSTLLALDGNNTVWHIVYMLCFYIMQFTYLC
jgi:hypothetical protein